MFQRTCFRLLSCLILNLGLLSPFCAALEIPAGYVLVPLNALENSFDASGGPVQESISTQHSALAANAEIIIIEQDPLILTATLRDQAGQPLSDRAVTLKSSRASDEIQKIDPTTGINGEARFIVEAQTAGVSKFTAIDENSGATVLAQPSIVFLEANETVENSLLSADVSSLWEDSSNVLNQIKVISFPENPKVNEPYDLAIALHSSNGELLEAFTGEVRFQSSDSETVLPQNYTFTDLDRGVHTFAGGLTFINPGTTTLTIATDDAETVELTVEVLGELTEAEKPLIITPADDFLTNQKFTVTGTATPNTNLAFLLNDQVALIGEADSTGSFEFETDPAHGSHRIAVALLDSSEQLGAISAEKNIEVDKEPPVLKESLEFTVGAHLELGNSTQIIFKSETALPVAEAEIGSEKITFRENSPETYTAEFTATEVGTFDIQLELQDIAGNSTLLTDLAEIEVTYPEPELTIFDLELIPRNQKIQLNFDPPHNQAEVNYYQIFYGEDENALENIFQTPDNGTAWEIINLDNEVFYFFKIFSYNADGRLNGFSEIHTGTPQSQTNLQAQACENAVKLNWRPKQKIAYWQIAYGLKSQEPTEFRTLSPADSDNNQYEIKDLINGITYFFSLKGFDENNQLILDALDEEVSATPVIGACREPQAVTQTLANLRIYQKTGQNGQITLHWEPVKQALGYRVFAGTQPNNFNLTSIDIPTTSYQPLNLQPNQTYYFAVQALYADKALNNNFSNILQIEVGPPLALLLASSLAVLGGLILRRKGNKGKNGDSKW